MLIAMIASHIWKLYRYNETKQMAATEKMLTAAWMSELVKKGAMNPIQETVSSKILLYISTYIEMKIIFPL